MGRTVTDEDILSFLRENWAIHRSQITLIQSAVELLWPEGLTEERFERVIRLCFEETRARVLSTIERPMDERD